MGGGERDGESQRASERGRRRRRMKRRRQSTLFKLTEIFTKLRVMRFPLKALFS